jgi:hypothetical protein
LAKSKAFSMALSENAVRQRRLVCVFTSVPIPLRQALLWAAVDLVI